MTKLIVWGGTKGMESHRWIQKGFADNARKLGMQSLWVDDSQESVKYLEPGVTVISADIYCEHLIPAAGVDYVLHNFGSEHIVIKTVDPENLLRLQVWTDHAFGEEWDMYRSYDRESRILFQPWGTSLLAEEFLEPVFNPLSREVTFVGAIWAEPSQSMGELGNVGAIEELKQAAKTYGLFFKHLTQISEEGNIEAVRSARLAPTITGEWQARRSYIPCRAFKNVSYGTLMFSNSEATTALFFPEIVFGQNIAEILENALALKARDYLAMVRAQQRVAARYTYRESLEAIFRALAEGK